MSDKVVLEITFPFWQVYIASLQLIRYSLYQLVAVAIFPLGGCVLIALWVISHHVLDGGDYFTLVLAFLFTPLMTAFNLFLSRRRNKLCKGPFTYTFDADGMHCDGEDFNLSVRWSAIPRVVETARFTYFFIAPASAHCIPRDIIEKSGYLQDLRNLVHQHVKSVKLYVS